MTGLLVVMFGELILSQEPFIMIIRFRMLLILPELIVWHDNAAFAFSCTLLILSANLFTPSYFSFFLKSHSWVLFLIHFKW